MTDLHMPVGTDYFRKLREEGNWYCDKTGFIARFLRNHADVSLFTRPRRFGKTLAMDTMAEFLDIAKDGRDIFAGLGIMKDETVCSQWMNNWPVISLTLKNVAGPDYAEAMKKMRELLDRWIESHSFLLSSPVVSEHDKSYLQDIPGSSEGRWSMSSALSVFAHAMAAHYGRPAVLLIDEYDVPVAKAEVNGYYEPMIAFIRSFLGDALKSNPDLKFAVLTGCLRIVKESIFTGLNNFACFPLSEVEHSDAFGFTPTEVSSLLDEAGLSGLAPVVSEWYDGYRFGKNTEIYCPWDVVCYVSRALGGNREPQAFWNNSSSNDVVRKLIERTAGAGTQEKVERLIAGGCIEEVLSDELTYDGLYDEEENIWSLLFQTGYLTRADETTMARCGCSGADGRTCLVIPNREIRSIYTNSVRSWFGKSVREMDRTKLFEALWSGDAATLTTILTDALYETISYHDGHEDFYHAFLAGMLTFAGWTVKSNRESGNGRPDLQVLDLKGRRAVIIEVKHAGGEDDLEPAARRALAQIEERKYAEGLPRRVTTVYKYGVAFFEKECLFLSEKSRG